MTPQLPTPTADRARPRALLVASLWPDANGTGTQRRIYQHLWFLSRTHDVDLVVQPRVARDSADRERTLSLCGSVLELPIVETNFFRIARIGMPGLTLLRELASAHRSTWFPYPRRRRKQVRDRIARFAGPSYELMLFARLDTAWLLDGLRPHRAPDCRVVLDLDDLDSSFMRQLARESAAEHGKELSLAILARARRLSRTEARLLHSFDIVTFASEADAGQARRYRPRARVEVLPNSVPLADHPLEPRPEDGTFRLLFVGFMGYGANSDAALYLVREVLPRLSVLCNGAVCLSLVGKDPPGELLALHDPPRVVVTGWVDDVLPYYRSADAVVMPLRIGSGTRIKAIEALNFGRPLVSTAFGVEGLGLEHERSVLIAETAEALAAACHRLFTDKALAATLVDNGRRHVLDHLAYDRVLERFSRMIGVSPTAGAPISDPGCAAAHP